MEHKIIIYGAGDYGKKLWNILNDWGISVFCFCQTVKTESKKLYDLDILSLNELKKIEEFKVILIAIENQRISYKVKLNLTNLFLKETVVYECGDFIKRNLNTISIDKKRYCIMCNSWVSEFSSFGDRGDLFGQYHIIGGGHRKNSICPICGSLDRTRWAFYVLSKYTNIFENKCKVLHFAPESSLSERIGINSSCEYYTCDIEAGRAMYVIDIRDIPFKDNIFDYVILNHVLEHIKDERQAISELKRVVKPGGKMILSFPICMEQKTLEGSGTESLEECHKLYGQEDHVRLYGNDFKERLEQYGLNVRIYTPGDEFNSGEAEKFGFIYDDNLIICDI